MPKAKATTTKKRQAKQAKAAAVAPKGNTGRRHNRAELTVQVVAMRKAGTGWEAMAAELQCAPGLCRLLWMTANVRPKDRIKGSPESIAKQIVEARNNDQAWGYIAARARISEGRVRRIYRETTGDDDKQGFQVVYNRTAAKQAAQQAAKPQPKAKKAAPKKVAAKKTTTRKKAA